MYIIPLLLAYTVAALAQDNSTITASPAMTTLNIFNFGGGSNDIEGTSVTVPLLGSIVAADACQTTVAIGYGPQSTAISYYAGQFLDESNVVRDMRP